MGGGGRGGSGVGRAGWAWCDWSCGGGREWAYHLTLSKAAPYSTLCMCSLKSACAGLVAHLPSTPPHILTPLLPGLLPVPHAPCPVPCLHTERDELLSEGFSNWMRRDFNLFVRACERHGRHNLAEVAREIESKTEEEVGAAQPAVGLVGNWHSCCGGC